MARISTALAMSAAVIVALTTGDALAQKRTLTVSSWGGAFQKAQRQAWFDVVEKELDITIKEETTSGIADVRAQVASGRPTLDLTTQGVNTCALLENEGKLEPLDEEVQKAAADIPANLKSTHWVSQIVYSVAIGWREAAWPGKTPNGWAAFWDVKNFPGKRSLRRHPIYALEMALIVDGVPMDKLYPLDVERAFKKLESLKDHVLVWWKSGAQSAQVLKDAEVDMVAAWNGRIQALQDDVTEKSGKINVSFEQQMLTSDCWIIPKGAPNKDLALKAVAIMSRAEVNARISNYINYAPANSKSYDTGVIPKEKLPGLPNSPENIKKGFFIDNAWWAKHGDEMVKRFDAFIQQ
jgi:putative spermidine/putrescine transport system substrate-binding protein